MIVLHSVTMTVGRKGSRVDVLKEVDWVIPPRSRFVILGQQAAHNTALLDVIGGMQMPTRGWVERKGIVSLTSGLTRHGGGSTTSRQLVHRLATLYEADPEELSLFVQRFADLEKSMNVPIRFLPRPVHRKLNLALFYGLPCDYYLYDGRVNFGPLDVIERSRLAFEERAEHSGMILATTNTRSAREFGGTAGILHQGSLYILESIEEAIAAFEELQILFPIQKEPPGRDDRPVEPEENEIDII